MTATVALSEGKERDCRPMTRRMQDADGYERRTLPPDLKKAVELPALVMRLGVRLIVA